MFAFLFLFLFTKNPPVSTFQKWSDELEVYSYEAIYKCQVAEGFLPDWQVEGAYADQNVFYVRRRSAFNESLPIQVNYYLYND